MSSFYGSGGYSSSGGGFPTETGTSSSPIILNTLDYGNYIIDGIFLYTRSDEEEKTASNLYVAIMEDPDTGQKVAKYEVVEGGIYYVYTIAFSGDEEYQVNKLFITAGEGVIFIDDTAYMPTGGIENILYVGWQAVYRWDANSQSFVNLSSSVNVWGNF